MAHQVEEGTAVEYSVVDLVEAIMVAEGLEADSVGEDQVVEASVAALEALVEVDQVVAALEENGEVRIL